MPLPGDLARDAGRGVVHGEVHDVPAAALDALDIFEGCPELYVRELVAVSCAGATLDAWAYVLAWPLPAQAAVVATGRYAGGGVVLADDARESLAWTGAPEPAGPSTPRTRRGPGYP